MRFYFPDSQDQIDPFFDFQDDEHLAFHVRQRDDLYAHEVHDEPPYDGILISKTMVDGYAGAGRYTAAHRHRLYRLGLREFFRLPDGMAVIGDCGAFSYVDEQVPPVTVSETIDFYEGVGVDEGISVDHVILGYRPELDRDGDVPGDWLERQAMTLELAAEFFAEHQRRGCGFTPVGVAQGWSLESYAASVKRLQEIGYQRIALGGMVPLKTHADRRVSRGGPTRSVLARRACTSSASVARSTTRRSGRLGWRASTRPHRSGRRSRTTRTTTTRRGATSSRCASRHPMATQSFGPASVLGTSIRERYALRKSMRSRPFARTRTETDTLTAGARRTPCLRGAPRHEREGPQA